jgi:putative peptidoglycan lipid II flippase
VSAAVALWIVTGLVVNAALAGRFGAGAAMDAYLAASTLPTLVAIVLQGGFTLTLVPVVVELEARGDFDASRRLFAAFFRWSLLLLGALALAVAVAAAPLVGLVVPGHDPKRTDLAAGLLRIFAPSLLLQGLSTYFQSVHYARHRYGAASLAPVAGNLATLFFVVAFGRRWGIASAAWGVGAGALLQCLLLARTPGPGAALLAPGPWGDPSLRKLAALLWPVLVGSILYRSNALVERHIVSYGPEKSISYLGFAAKVIGFLVMLVSQGMSLTLLSRLSAQAARGEEAALRTSLGQALRASLLLSIPATLLLAAVRVPVVQVLFERKAFLPEDTAGTSSALLCYLGAVLGGCVGTTLSRVLYARQRTRIAVAIGIAGAALHLLLAALLFRPYGFRGVALAYSASQLACVLLLALVARRLIGSLDLKPVLAAGAASLLASVPMALGASLLVRALGLERAPMAGKVSGLACTGVASLSAFLLLAHLLGVEEIGWVLGRLRRALSRRAA